jgi:CHASE3 domain sensor protein
VKWSVDKLNTVRFGTAITTLIGLAILSCISLLRLYETTRQVRQSQQVLGSVLKPEARIEIAVFER